MCGIGQKFMEMTKYQYLAETDQERGLSQPPLEDDYPRDAVLIELPQIGQIRTKELDLARAIAERKTVRKYAPVPLTLEELSYLLWCTQGVKQISPRPATMRTVPSAGARHAFETYLLVNNVTGLRPGLYRYIALEHKLLTVKLDPTLTDKLVRASGNQLFIRHSAVTFIWSTTIYRMKWRYGERGYRYIHLDAGHVCQNLYLAAQAVESGVCAIAAYDDDELCKLLSLDGEERFVVYLATVGKV